LISAGEGAGRTLEKPMRRAVYAGSFDPITLGHVWMIQNGSRLFNELVVAIGDNPDKHYTFSLDERVEMLQETVRQYANVKVASFQNLFLVNYARQIDAGFILRGIRNEVDYGYERGMRHINAEFNTNVMTVFLMPPRELAEISSSFVKGMVGPAGWEQIVAKYVPTAVHERIVKRFGGMK
jgi:pantetheine-phosphate adenylyltransferase